MTDLLNEEEIWARYPDEWVLIGSLETDASLRVTAGRVLFHSKDRNAVDREMLEAQEPRIAVFYTGQGPEIEMINL